MTDPPVATTPTMPNGAVVEIRTYLLRPGQRDEYDRIFREDAAPLLEAFGIEVVAHGPSLLDDDHYFLVRAYPSLAERQAAEERFYGSPEWREGIRQEVLSRLISYHEVVLPASPRAIEALRTFGSGPGTGAKP